MTLPALAHAVGSTAITDPGRGHPNHPRSPVIGRTYGGAPNAYATYPPSFRQAPRVARAIAGRRFAPGPVRSGQQCPLHTHWDPIAGQCVPDVHRSRTQHRVAKRRVARRTRARARKSPCAPGWVYDPKTRRCVKKRGYTGGKCPEGFYYNAARDWCCRASDGKCFVAHITPCPPGTAQQGGRCVPLPGGDDPLGDAVHPPGIWSVSAAPSASDARSALMMQSVARKRGKKVRRKGRQRRRHPAGFSGVRGIAAGSHQPQGLLHDYNVGRYAWGHTDAGGQRPRRRQRYAWGPGHLVQRGYAGGHHHDHGNDKGGACCQSCADGGECEGGCGAACTCGKES